MVHPKHHHTIVIAILLGVILLFGLLIFSLNFKKDHLNLLRVNTERSSQLYMSENFNVSLYVPDGFTVEEKYTMIVLENNDGTIILNSSGTNYNDIRGYVDYIQNINNFNLEHEREEEIDNNDVISGFVGSEKLYFFYPAEWTIYTLSTHFPDLYDELDQIAQSFRYTP